MRFRSLGGCGKTTTMRQIHEMLPSGSISIFFDCYGAGRYTHSDDRRHLPENAFLQIINELALEQSVPLLLAKQSSGQINVKTFIERISTAAQELKNISPHSLLTILIDAADNSVSAAERDVANSACFIWEIANADFSKIPDNFRIVISSRTGRKDSLRLPSITQYIDCPPFDLSETKAYSNTYYPTLSEDWINQFHMLSNGIPRVQSYAFRKGGISPDNVLDALRPSGKGLITVLEELFREAAKKGGQDFYEKCVSAINILPGPIPITHLASVCDVSGDIIRDFVLDVSPTLRIEGDKTVTIADEDVEDFLKEEAISQHEYILNKACSFLNSIYNTDTYAATHFCELLVLAGRASEILPLIEKDVVPKGIEDPVIRREVQIRRLRFALNACQSANSTPGIFKVVLLSAEATNDEHTLKQLLQQEPALAVRFASGSIFRLFTSNRDTYPEQGTFIVHDALRAAMQGDRTHGFEQLRIYNRWMQRRDEQEHGYSWVQSHDDIVTFAKALILIHGTKNVFYKILKWGDRNFRFRLVVDVIYQLIHSGHRNIVEDAYSDKLLPKHWNLLLSVPLAMSGYAIDKNRLEADLLALKKSRVPDFRLYFGQDHWKLNYLETIITACEIAFTLNINTETLLQVLSRVTNCRETSADSINYRETLKLDIALRAWLLQRHLTPNGQSVSATEISASAKLKGDENRDFSSPHLLGAQEFLEFSVSKNKKIQGDPSSKQNFRSRTVDDSQEKFKRALSAIYRIYLTRLATLDEHAHGKNITTTRFNLAQSVDGYNFENEYVANEFRFRIAKSIAQLIHTNGLSSKYIFESVKTNLSSRDQSALSTEVLPIWKTFLARPEVHQHILDEITVRSTAIRHLKTSAQSKTDTLLKFSELVLSFSPDDAKALFENAIEIAQEVDRAAMMQLEFVAGLTVCAKNFSGKLRRQLAVAFASYVTDVAIRLEGEDRFPWTKAVKAILDLSPEVALAAASQWQDEGVVDFDDSLMPIINRLIHDEKKYVLASALLGLVGYIPERGLHSAIEGIKAAPVSDQKIAYELLSKKLLLDVSTPHRASRIELLAKHLPEGVPTGLATDQLKIEAGVLREQIDCDKTNTEVPDLIIFPVDADFSSQEGISVAIKSGKSGETGKHTSLYSILMSARGRISEPSHRLHFLNAISEFQENSFGSDDRAKVLLDTLSIWTGPAITKWRTQQLPKIISQSLFELSRWLREGYGQLTPLITASGLAGQDLITVIINGIERRSNDYSSEVLFGLCELMAPNLIDKDASEIANWYISRLSHKLPEDMAERFLANEIPNTMTQAIGRFVFALFSDIDLSTRWRAAHFVRDITSLEGGWLIGQLLDVYHAKSDRTFRLGEAPFYWLAARLFTMVTIARIAFAEPSTVAPFVHKLLSIALDETLPHYLIRSYAKSAVKAVLLHDSQALSPAERDALALANEPRVAPKSPNRRSSRELKRVERKNERFKFNSLDTIPHWLAPIYQRFATLGSEKFYQTLERWIIDEWNADPEANWWNKEPRSKRHARDSMSSYHRQGIQPKVERWGTYLELHSMFCAIGELIQTEPLIVAEYDYDSLEYSIHKWKPTEPPTWLADRRGFRPIDEEFVIDKVGKDNHWLARVPKTRFLAAMLGGKLSNRNELAIHGDWTISGKTRQIELNIKSALVEPTSASALLRTVSRKSKKFWLPTENDHDEDSELETPPFRLYAWLKRIGGDLEYDEYDPWRAEVRGLQIKPCSSLIKKFDLKEQGLPISKWTDQTDQEWFRYESWADWRDTDGRRWQPRPVGSNGYRLVIQKNALKAIMKSENLDLITEVEIERRLENESGEPSEWNDKKRRRQATKIFVFRHNGEIEDSSGYVGNW